MPIEIQQTYLRESIRANPSKIYVFGDNMERRGFGGQALEARGEYNAVGIPTKWKPRSEPDAFFKDSDLDFVQPIILGEFRKLYWYLKKGYTIVWPSDGIGTGRAQLQTKAPAIAKLIDCCL